MAERSLPDYDEIYRMYLEQLRLYEERKGRRLLPSERLYFTEQFYSPHYRAEVRRLEALETPSGTKATSSGRPASP